MTLASADLPRFLLALTALLAAAHLGGHLFHRLQQPRVIGEILGGTLLGPTCLTRLFPEPGAWLFPGAGAVSSALGAVQQLGVVMLMFVAGLELRGFVGATGRRLVAALAAGGMLLPFAAGLLAMQALSPAHLLGAANDATAFVLVFSAAVAVTSISVISRIMLDLGILNSSFARTVLSTAVIEDIVLYVVLAAAVSLAASGAGAGIEAGLSGGVSVALQHAALSVAFLLVALAVGRPLVGRALRSGGPRGVSGLGLELALLLGITGLGCVLGITSLFGALVAGMLVSGGQPPAEASASPTASFSSAFFSPLYFAMVGLRLDLLRQLDLLWFGGFLVLSCCAKMGSVYAAARCAGLIPRRAADYAVALNARGGPGIVMASVALDAHIINERFFTILVLTAIATSFTAGAWLGRRSLASLDAPAPEGAIVAARA